MTTNTSANDPTGERAAFAAGYAEAVATSKRIDDYQRTFLATGFTDAEKPPSKQHAYGHVSSQC